MLQKELEWKATLHVTVKQSSAEATDHRVIENYQDGGKGSCKGPNGKVSVSSMCQSGCG